MTDTFTDKPLKVSSFNFIRIFWPFRAKKSLEISFSVTKHTFQRIYTYECFCDKNTFGFDSLLMNFRFIDLRNVY